MGQNLLRMVIISYSSNVYILKNLIQYLVFLDGIEEFDFVIIGAGSGGSTVAGRLSENPDWNILLIEAGGNPPIESEVGIFLKEDGKINNFLYLNCRYLECSHIL